MAYGDSAASIVSEKYGKRKYRIFADKSLEGLAAMFFASFSFTISLIFFSAIYSFSVFEKILPSLAVAAVATLVESFSPTGFDNPTVPIRGACCSSENVDIN